MARKRTAGSALRWTPQVGPCKGLWSLTPRPLAQPTKKIGHELYKKSALLARQRGMNISPFRRVDNGTMTFDKWSTETTHAHTVVDTFMKIHDPEAREWNDKPCTPVSGLALGLHGFAIRVVDCRSSSTSEGLCAPSMTRTAICSSRFESKPINPQWMT